jgi:polyisoprenyl-phosphate glycosyltransferase
MKQASVLTIVIPCYNESKSILTLVGVAAEISKNYPITFILVNNGSTDKTREILESKREMGLKILHLEQNRGYGAGIKAGLKITETEYVGWTHADLQTSLKDLIIPLEMLTNDRVFIKGNRIYRSATARFFSIGMGCFESLLFRMKLFEINAQPTIFHSSLMEGWDPPDDFALDLYSYVLAKKMNYEEIRFYVRFNDRLHGESKWNYSIKSRFKFILRTITYSIKLVGRI